MSLLMTVTVNSLPDSLNTALTVSTNSVEIMASTVNKTEREFPPIFPHMIVVASVLALLVASCVIGNILVILSVLVYKPLRNVQNFLIISLAVSDLLVAAIVMPFHLSNLLLGYWLYGWLFCELWLTFDVLLCTASILNLCAIALDRYWAIHDPLNYAQKRTLQRVGIIIAIVWMTSAVVSVPPMFGWNASGRLYDEEEKVCHLTDEKGYVIYSACGSFYIPLAMMTFIYLKIFLAIRRRLKKRRQQTAMTKMKNMSSQTPEPNPAPEENTNEDLDANSETQAGSADSKPSGKDVCVTTQNGATHSKLTKAPSGSAAKGKRMRNFWERKQKISLSKERKAARVLGIVMGAFIVCWLPFFLLYIILPFCASCTSPGVVVETIVVWLGYLNSGLNPVIYTIFNEEFRKAFQLLLCKSCMRSRLKQTKL